MVIKNTFKWSSLPIKTFLSHPYTISLNVLGIEIRHTTKHELIQVSNMNVEYASNDKHIIIANENTIWKVLPFDIEDQVYIFRLKMS